MKALSGRKQLTKDDTSRLARCNALGERFYSITCPKDGLI